MNRGIILSILLSTLILSPIVTSIILITMDLFVNQIQFNPPWAPYVFSIICLFLSFFSLAAWNRKKYGIISTIVLLIILPIILIIIKQNTISMITGAIALVSILISGINWKYFTD